MKRFFFDYTAKDQALLDYGGHEFRTAVGALEFAQEIAHSLKHSISSDWTGWSIEVRTADGEKFISLPVESELLSAA